MIADDRFETLEENFGFIPAIFNDSDLHDASGLHMIVHDLSKVEMIPSHC